MPYLAYSQIRRLHLELTNHCNAACPQCDRNVYGAGVNPRLTLGSLTLGDVQNMLPPELCSQLFSVTLAGVHGDPMMAPEAKEICDYLIASGVRALQVHTNGGMRNAEWWAALGAGFRPGDEVTFGIDGLEDTHSIYRRGTSWQKATENLRAFTAAGGRAQWSFLVFRHNEHQVHAARALAKEWGCATFRVRMTGRFQSLGFRHGKAPFPVLKRNPGRPVDGAFVGEVFEKIGPGFSGETNFAGLLGEHGFEYTIEESSREEWRNEATKQDLDALINQHGGLTRYLDETKISCLEREAQQLYIDASARLWPCCYIGGDTKSWHHRHRFREDLEQNLLQRYGREFNDLRTHGLAEVLEHPWFKEQLVASWANETGNGPNPRLKRCARTCGEKFRLNPSQNRSLEMGNG